MFSYDVFISSDSITVVVGAHNIKKEEPTARSIKVAKMIVHPGYDKVTIRNDIALLQLESRVTLGTNCILYPVYNTVD